MKPFLSFLLILIFAYSGSSLAEPFDEQALLSAAKKEPPLQIYASTGKIKEQASNFAKKYDLDAIGTKAKVTQTIRIVTGEQKANNIRAGVIAISDAPAAMTELIGPGYVVNYLPSSMADKIPEAMQDPLFLGVSSNVFSYNTALNKEGCPVRNVWELTEPKWKGHVTMQDPLGKPAFTDWFNQLEEHHDADLAKAYELLYGRPLTTNFSSATEAWVAALAKNQPLLTKNDGSAAEAVGAPDTKENFIGLFSTAKFRENKNGMKLGICADLEPFVGYSIPSLIFIVKGTPSPNAAKLFVHYMLTEEGFAPQAIDGKVSSNPEVKSPEEDPSGILEYLHRLTFYNTKTVESDWNTRQDWQDLWTINHYGR